VRQTKVRLTSSLFPEVVHCDLNDSFEIRRCQKSATNYDDRRAICKLPDQTIKGAVRARQQKVAARLRRARRDDWRAPHGAPPKK